ncbi:MAG: ISAs1 family transposase [Pseudomonadota bacterium]
MRDFECVFSVIDDPRAPNVSHRLGDLLIMMIAASLCGASTATEFALFAETRKPLLKQIITYDHAPSHDTFSRLLRLMNPEQFTALLSRFATAFGQTIAPPHRTAASADQTDQDAPAPVMPPVMPPAMTPVIAIDGKTLRAAHEAGCKTAPPLTVSAFATHTRLCLAMATPSQGDNEVEAALRVVQLIDMAGKIITADALHCHRRMAKAITSRGGDYMLALKGNRSTWHGQAVELFQSSPPDQTCETKEISHGRKEWRKAEVIAVHTPVIEGHKAYVRLTSKRDDQPCNHRYYITSLQTGAAEALRTIRQHWAIENNLHWVLDVHLNEDQNRGRKDHAISNIAILKRIARNILQIVDKPKVPISHRIKKCAWDETYLINAISHMR